MLAVKTFRNLERLAVCHIAYLKKAKIYGLVQNLHSRGDRCLDHDGGRNNSTIIPSKTKAINVSSSTMRDMQHFHETQPKVRFLIITLFNFQII